MTTDNAAQIAEWNGVQGERWAAMTQQTESIVLPFGAAAIAAAALQPGERVIDVGCGCGDTSIELARQVGPDGAVLGVDVSRPMLAVATERAAQAALPQLAFRERDAANADLPCDLDLLYSRFGVMFFAAPAAAFAHMRSALRPGGRVAFVCWRAPRENPWAMAPLSAARTALGVDAAPADPNAPGPFAFASESRVREILIEAGFGAIETRRFDAKVTLGPTPRAAAEAAARIGPTSRFIREVGSEHLPAIVDAVEKALAPLAAPDGVHLPGSTWIVSARNR